MEHRHGTDQTDEMYDTTKQHNGERMFILILLYYYAIMLLSSLNGPCLSSRDRKVVSLALASFSSTSLSDFETRARVAPSPLAGWLCIEPMRVQSDAPMRNAVEAASEIWSSEWRETNEQVTRREENGWTNVSKVAQKNNSCRTDSSNTCEYNDKMSRFL